jgi:hypothetical protein
MSARKTLSMLALLAVATPVMAATQEECLSLWKTADVNANGALTQDEDKNGYIAAAIKSGKPLLQPSTLSRDEFIQLCTTNVIGSAAAAPNNSAATPPGPAAARDLGKGDLTPAQHPLTETDARDKLTANGFREIQKMEYGAALRSPMVDPQRRCPTPAFGDDIGRNFGDGFAHGHPAVRLMHQPGTTGQCPPPISKAGIGLP